VAPGFFEASYFHGGRSVSITPGRLMTGVETGKVGNGHGQEGVPGVGTEGTTVGVLDVGCDADGFGGVFRDGGGVLDSCTIVVFGSSVGLELRSTVDAPGDVVAAGIDGFMV